MTSAVLAFAGAIGSGKTTISAGVAGTLGWARVSFGDYVRAEARRRGLDDSSREVLQEVGEALIAQGWEPFCQAILAQALWVSGEPLVIDGVRHVRAVETLRELVAPAMLLVVYLDADEDVRRLRLREREGTYSARPYQIEMHLTEADVATRLRALADYRVNAAVERDVVTQQIVAWLGCHGIG